MNSAVPRSSVALHVELGPGTKGCCDLSLQFDVPPVQCSQVTSASGDLAFCAGCTKERLVLKNE